MAAPPTATGRWTQWLGNRMPGSLGQAKLPCAIVCDSEVTHRTPALV